MPSTENLANLLADHPFADERDLLCTIDRTVTVEEARSLVAQRAARLLHAGVRAGGGGGRPAPERPGTRGGDARHLVHRRGLRPAQRPLPRGRGPPRARHHPSRPPCSMRTACSCSRHPLRHDPDIAFVTWTSGTTGPPKAILQSHSGYLELLDRVLKPLRGDGGRQGGRPRAHPEPGPGVGCPQRRHLQRLLRPAGRRGRRPDAPLRDDGLRRAGPPLSGPLDGAAARRHGHAHRRPGGDRPVAAALRAQHHRPAVAAGRPTLHGALRRDGAEQLRAGRGGRGRRAGRPPTPGSTPRSSAPPGGRSRAWTSGSWTARRGT